jgi:hypothetical protein
MRRACPEYEFIRRCSPIDSCRCGVEFSRHIECPRGVGSETFSQSRRRYLGSMAITHRFVVPRFCPMCVPPDLQATSPVFNVEGSSRPSGLRGLSVAPERQTTTRALCECCGSLVPAAILISYTRAY